MVVETVERVDIGQLAAELDRLVEKPCTPQSNEDLLVFSEKNPLLFNPHTLGQPGMENQVPVLPVYWNEVFRLCEIDHQF